MKLIDIPPNYLNKEFASKICKNKKLMKKYIQKYDLWEGYGGTIRKSDQSFDRDTSKRFKGDSTMIIHQDLVIIEDVKNTFEYTNPEKHVDITQYNINEEKGIGEDLSTTGFTIYTENPHSPDESDEPIKETHSTNIIELFYNFRDNKCTGLMPDIIGSLQHLKILNLSNNMIVNIPDSIGELRSLTELNLSNNNIGNSIPDSIGKLHSLTELNLSNNQIVSNIPETIGQLTSLTELDLSHNKIDDIPQSIGNLKSLITLHLYNNKIVIIPETIGQLTSLIELYLQHNSIIRIPDSIGDLKSLCNLQLDDNNLINPAFLTHVVAIDSLKHLGVMKNMLKGNIVFELRNETKYMKVFLFSDNPNLTATITIFESPDSQYIHIDNKRTGNFTITKKPA
jgi:Leucine-rich repeat (LRR) protein